MTLLDEIAKQLSTLPPDKQIQVLDFIASLRERADVPPRIKPDSLKKHVAFGSSRRLLLEKLGEKKYIELTGSGAAISHISN